MYGRAKRLAARIGLSPAEQEVVAAGGLRAAERAAAWLGRRAARGGLELRPVVLAAVLAVALAAVAEDAEFNDPPAR